MKDFKMPNFSHGVFEENRNYNWPAKDRNNDLYHSIKTSGRGKDKPGKKWPFVIVIIVIVIIVAAMFLL